ncbi:reverse transcriptase domain-containing protein [Tanacetum coccineum]
MEFLPEEVLVRTDLPELATLRQVNTRLRRFISTPQFARVYNARYRITPWLIVQMYTQRSRNIGFNNVPLLNDVLGFNITYIFYVDNDDAQIVIPPRRRLYQFSDDTWVTSDARQSKMDGNPTHWKHLEEMDRLHLYNILHIQCMNLMNRGLALLEQIGTFVNITFIVKIDGNPQSLATHAEWALDESEWGVVVFSYNITHPGLEFKVILLEHGPVEVSGAIFTQTLPIGRYPAMDHSNSVLTATKLYEFVISAKLALSRAALPPSTIPEHGYTTAPEKTPKEADATPRVNIQDFCEEHYEDILPVIMDKIRRDKRKEVHARLDFEESPKKRRIREGSQNSSARTLSARYRNPSERLKVRDRLRYNERHVLDRLGHRRQSAFDRLSDSYSPSTTKSGPDIPNSKDRSHSRSHPHRRDSFNRDRPRSRDRSRGVEESYDNTRSSYGTGTKHGYRSRDSDHPRYEKKGRESESPSSRVSESGTSDGGHWKSRSKRHKSMDEDDLAVPWICEEVDPFTPRIRNFKRAARVWFNELPPESIDGYKDLKAAFLAYFMQQKKYVKDSVEIHNIKQRDGETIEEFMERFKRLNEHVPKTMEEMMINTTAFIRGEAAAAGKKKGHTSWRTQDQSKRHDSDWRSDFRGQPRDGRGSSKFTPLTRTPKEILAIEAGKFKPPPPMVTLVEKRSSNKFCDFHNDKGHSKDECMQLKKQIEELVRADKLSHLIKEIKHGRDQPKVGKKEVPAKDKSMAIYMIQPWHRMTRQKVTQSFERVSEITFPSLTTSSGIEGPLVIEAEIGGHMIYRMYVDGGSSTKVLYEHCFNQLRPEIKNQMVPATTSLTDFSRETVWPLGQLRLLVTIGDADHSTRAWMNFMIVSSLSSYNGIIGRHGIREIQAVPSTAHGMLKFPVDEGIVTISSTILILAECAKVITSSKEIPKEDGVRHENFKVALHPNFPDQEKLVEAGIMREVYYHEWLSNPVMVKKHDGSWRICVDFTDLNKALFIGRLQRLSPDTNGRVRRRENGFPHQPRGILLYQNAFRPQNAGATYQRLIDKAFDSQVGRNIEVYVDDLVIKSHTKAEMLRDIDETFCTLRKINMKLNPKKCTFEAVKGMFLGYMISPEGIKPCPDKTEAVLQLPSPQTIKEVQNLNGKLASLNRFLSKSAERSFPLLKTLKKCIKKSDFHWTPEAKQAFKQLKQHLSKLPLLVAPKPKEKLIVYLSVTHGAISVVLMTERGMIQTLAYFVSRTL